MAVLKKNIWSLFIVILFASSCLLIFSIVSLWERNKQHFLDYQYGEVERFSNASEAFLKSQESLLEVLGNQLALDNPIPVESTHSPILDRVRSTHPAMAGLGLANLEGKLVVVSSNLNLSKLPNLLTQKTSRDSFLATLQEDKLTIGRTYVVDALEDASMAIAIRKTVRDAKGKPVAVMTSGIKVNHSVFFDDNPSYHRMDIIREDGYYQFSSAQTSSGEVYKTAVSKRFLENIRHSAMSQNALNEQTLKQSRQPYVAYIDIDGVDYQLMVEYDPYFHFWTVSRIRVQYINQQFYSGLLTLLFLFTLASSLLYILVRSISISEKEKLSELRYQALHDTLTGLPNRRYLNQVLDEREGESLSIICINIDRFKTLNDCYGYSYGDKILIQVAHRLEMLSKESLWLAKGSADEFYFVSNEETEQELMALCDIVQKSITEPYQIGDVNIFLTSSIAVTTSITNQEKKDELMRALDIALINAKKTRNAVVFVAAETQQEYMQHLYIEHKLREAIKHMRIFMMYQPQISRSGDLLGVEALVRWVDEELGFIPPDQFIGIAEYSGLMPELGKLIIKLALDDIATIQTELDISFKLSLNISVKQFLSEQFSDHLIEQIKHRKIPLEKVTVEITESIFIEDIRLIKAHCEKLINAGISLSLDDFGTGYSSLSILSKLPISELKIDKSFVDQIGSDHKALLMIENIIDIGKNHGMTVLAEGVETKQQEKILNQFGCDCFQGYLFAKPMKSDALISYVKSSHFYQ